MTRPIRSGGCCSTSWPWWPNSRPTSSDLGLARACGGPRPGHLRAKQPKLNPGQEAHLVELLYSSEYSTAELGDLFGVARSTVYRAVARSKKPVASGRNAIRHRLHVSCRRGPSATTPLVSTARGP